MPVVKPGDRIEDEDVEHVEVAVGCDRDKVWLDVVESGAGLEFDEMEESDTIVELEMKQLGADVIAMEGSEFMLMVELLNEVDKGEGKEPTELEKIKFFSTIFF